MTRLAMIADLDRCTGCLSCVVACEEEHDLAPGLSHIRVDQVGPEGEFPELTMYYVPVVCQQCSRPSCADACSEDAIGRGEDGTLTVAGERCTGCAACVDACPYQAIALDSAQGLARLCDLCLERRSAGRAPACVDACPARALAVADTEGDGWREAGLPTQGSRLASRALLPSRGSGPSARFVLTRQEWLDVM